MKRAAFLAFSAQGEAMARRAASTFPGEARVYRPGERLQALVAELFPCVDALVFVGACGIAVRTIAPHLQSKDRDPAVLVLDERGEYVISLVSGHIGGANELARELAGALNAQAVITTGTDVNRRFSVDAWAQKNGLAISDLTAAKRVSIDILERDLSLWSEFPLVGALPDGIVRGTREDCRIGVGVSPRPGALWLIPRLLHLGIGCRRGAEQADIAEVVQAALEANALTPRAVAAVASIDRKAGEAGLVAYCAAAGYPLYTYAASELAALPGTFTASEFVQKTVGVDNVCERSALLDAGTGGRLIVNKRGGNGVTVAIACEDWRMEF